MISFSKYEIAKMIQKNSCFIISKNVLLNLILSILEKLYTISYIIYFVLLSLKKYFVFNTYFNPTGFLLKNRQL